MLECNAKTKVCYKSSLFIFVRLLDCLHAICTACCEKIISQHNKVICPLCSMEMHVKNAKEVPNSALHALLLDDEPKIKCSCIFTFFFHTKYLASDCKNSALWKMEQTGVLVCDEHMKQMPFFKFFPFDQAVSPTLCCVPSHGFASKFCNKCKQSLCDKCAFLHASHGAVDLALVQKEIQLLFDEHLTWLHTQRDQSKALQSKAKSTLRDIQKVPNAIANLICRKIKN